jgi:hypothetical protein
MTFAVGVLSIPSSLYVLGLGAGIVNVGVLFKVSEAELPDTLFFQLIGWGAINTYCALLMGQFKNEHPSVHSISDAPKVIAKQLGFSDRTSVIVREIFEAIYIFTCILAAGVSMLGLGIALNAVSRHSACTVIWNVVAFLLITGVGSIRKIGKSSCVL